MKHSSSDCQASVGALTELNRFVTRAFDERSLPRGDCLIKSFNRTSRRNDEMESRMKNLEEAIIGHLEKQKEGRKSGEIGR